MLTDILQALLPAFFEYADTLQFANLQSGIATIESLNINIAQTPAVLAAFPANSEGHVNLERFKDRGEVWFCRENNMIGVTLKDIRVTGNASMTVPLATSQAKHEANFAGNLESISLGIDYKESEVSYLNFTFEKDSLSVGFLGERPLVENRELESSAIELLTTNKELLIKELKPMLNEIVLTQLKKMAATIISMQKEHANPFGFTINEMDVLRMIRGLLPRL